MTTKTMIEFTKGPWSAERVDYDLHGMDVSFEVNAGFKTIAQTHMREIASEGELIAQDEANCHLIAAAPELYEALKSAIELLDDCEIAHPLAWEIALAKARGQSTISMRGDDNA